MTRQDLIAALWHGRDPFADPPEALRPLDLQGWRSQHCYLEAGHEEASVAADLRAWWPVLRPGGLFIAADYDSLGGKFPGVTHAVDAFCAEFDVQGPWSFREKAKFVKPCDTEGESPHDRGLSRQEG